MSDIGNEVFKAIGWKKLPFGGNDLYISLDANACHEVARLIAPLIAGAQAMALEEAANEASAWDAAGADEPVHAHEASTWLRARAAKLRGES